jgi:hypothetical protein
LTTTAAPSFANPLAISAPIPFEAPVLLQPYFLTFSLFDFILE